MFAVGDLPRGEGAVLRRFLPVRDVRILHGAMARAIIHDIQPRVHVRTAAAHPHIDVRLHNHHHFQ